MTSWYSVVSMAMVWRMAGIVLPEGVPLTAHLVALHSTVTYNADDPDFGGIALNITGYEDAFQRYERRQLEHRRLQDEIRDFLARFTGEAKLAEAPFVLRDLARMEGLRHQRDDAYQEFHAAEQE